MKLKAVWKSARTADRIIILIYILAFAGACYNHTADLARHGLFPYNSLFGVPQALNIYWTSLTILDPLAILLLFFRPRAGCLLYLLIMLTDVPINIYADMVYWKQPLPESPGLLMQIAFLLFLLLSVGRIMKLSKTETGT